MEDCIFCKIVKGEIPCFKVYEDDRVLAFMDINPISEGHTLIIPRKHAQDLWEIPEEDLAAIHLASRKIGQAMQKALGPAGVAVLQLNGRGVNQVVMHYHLHLMPRASGRPELPVTVWEKKEGDMTAIRMTAEKISGALKKKIRARGACPAPRCGGVQKSTRLVRSKPWSLMKSPPPPFKKGGN